MFYILESKSCSYWSEILYLRSMQLGHRRLFRGDLTRWLQGLNSLEMTCAESSISTVNVNSDKNTAIEFYDLWCNLRTKVLPGVWTFPVYLNPRKCTKLTSTPIVFMLVTLHIQRIEMSSVFSDLMSALLPSPQDRDKEEKNLLSFFFFFYKYLT